MTLAEHTSEQLVDALNSLGVHFLLGGTGSENTTIESHQLIRALAKSEESRVRLALIPLFLQRPEYGEVARAVDSELSITAQLYLRCYYTAAHLLQQKYQAQLGVYLGSQKELCDHFSDSLELSLNGSVQRGLEALAQRHADLSKRRINWLGTYEHAAERTLKRLKHEQGLPTEHFHQCSQHRIARCLI